MTLDQAKERFERFVSPEPMSGCWLWTGMVNHHGYGHFRLGKMRLAHRVSYEWAKGPIPAGLTLDHLCRVRPCVNPAHLEPVTPRENILRGVSIISAHANATHCPSGHPYSGSNLYTRPRGGRICRMCMNESGKKYRAAKQRKGDL